MDRFAVCHCTMSIFTKAPHPRVGHHRLITRYEDYIKSKYGKLLGTCAVPLDSRESALRYNECNFGNFICDCVQDKMESHMMR